MPKYIYFYLYIDWNDFASLFLLQKHKCQLWAKLLLKFSHLDLPWNKMFAFLLDVSRLRNDSFVGKRSEIHVLKSMGKFIAASTETYSTLGVLQLISIAAQSSLWFTLLPLHSPYNPLAKRLLMLNFQVNYPFVL